MGMTIPLQEFDNINFTVLEFIKKVDAEFKKNNSHKNYGYLTRERGRHRELKKFIEEILPLQKYLLYRLNNGMKADTVKWQKGNQKGDAILDTGEIIEITVAEHEKEYIVREHMNKRKPTFCAEGASKEKGVTKSIPVVKTPEDRINTHTKMIEDAINKKLEKYDKIYSLVIYLNQDGLLEEEEFNTVIENIKSFNSLNKIENVFIWSFQHEAFINFKKYKKDDVLNSTPESNPVPQAEKGGSIMKSISFQICHLLYRVSRAMGSTLARIYRLCCGIKFSGIGVSLIPGIITCNISFRAGGAGSAHHLEFR